MRLASSWPTQRDVCVKQAHESIPSRERTINHPQKACELPPMDLLPARPIGSRTVMAESKLEKGQMRHEEKPVYCQQAATHASLACVTTPFDHLLY